MKKSNLLYGVSTDEVVEGGVVVAKVMVGVVMGEGIVFEVEVKFVSEVLEVEPM